MMRAKALRIQYQGMIVVQVFRKNRTVSHLVRSSSDDQERVGSVGTGR